MDIKENFKNLIHSIYSNVKCEKRKIIVIESDDWGLVRIPDKNISEVLKREFYPNFSTPYSQYDSLEQLTDLETLFRILQKHRDSNNNSPTITANFIMENPDFGKIEKDKFEIYYTKNIKETYSNSKDGFKVFNTILKATEEKLFHPQLHGNEHLDWIRWMEFLKDEHSIFRRIFKYGVYSADFDMLSIKKNLLAALDFNSENDNLLKSERLLKSTDTFESFFGYRSKSFIAPSYTWTDLNEEFLFKGGVQILQGILNQKKPVGKNNGYKFIKHYNGTRNKLGQVYMMRNVFFEPSLLKNRNSVVDQCLKRIKIAFAFGNPVIISSHRVNFMGSLDSNNRDQNLKLLDELLTEILKNWPDVEFHNSESAAKLITGFTNWES